jgi:hypothetical protein
MGRAGRGRTGAIVFLCCACTAPEGGRDPEVGLAASLLPNAGLAASASAAVRRTEAEWRAEARFTDQFVDDKALSDNDRPEAGNWTQLELGLRADLDPDAERSWLVRFGAIGFEARGEPNIVDESGEYVGVYVGVGYRAWFSGKLAFGPELVLIAASGPDPFVLVPQLVWGVSYRPGGGAEVR